MKEMYKKKTYWKIRDQKRHKNRKGEKRSRATARADLFNDTKLNPSQMPLHIKHLKLNFKAPLLSLEGTQTLQVPSG